MRDILDPQLLALVEHCTEGAADSSALVEVLVGLDAAADASTREELRLCGLTLRSEIGDVLTGLIKVEDVLVLAAHDKVIKIEASAPLRSEGPVGRGSLPTE